MHVRWRGLELPAQVELDQRSASDTFGRFTIEPFERGFGTTVGNSLRRILLSSIEGAAIINAQAVTCGYLTSGKWIDDFCGRGSHADTT